MTKLREALPDGTLLKAAIPIWAERLAKVADGLGKAQPQAPATLQSLSKALSGLIQPRDRAQIWLALATLTAQLPFWPDVIETSRRAEFNAMALIDEVIRYSSAATLARKVEIVSGAVLVDVGDTVRNPNTTGIQRVVRETCSRWAATHDPLFVGWIEGWQGPRPLSMAEQTALRRGIARPKAVANEIVDSLIIPWRCAYLIPEVCADWGRAERITAMVEAGAVRASGIGYDLIPISSGETAAKGMAGVFARYLTVLRTFRHLSTISAATKIEYGGYLRMLRAAGINGPEVRAQLLPTEASRSTTDAVANAEARLRVGDFPIVLAVGSHEPRKNHLAILHACEVLWRRGLRFSMAFIGGNSWKSEGFMQQLQELAAAGRPVEAISRASDEFLWAAYRVASFTVFPSLNEGYGLPIAESLSVGTPVITSNFGSTKEIADDGGGALLIDPRDDKSLTDAMAALLTDGALLKRLRQEAARREPRTWDDYAEQVWRFLVDDDGAPPA